MSIQPSNGNFMKYAPSFCSICLFICMAILFSCSQGGKKAVLYERDNTMTETPIPRADPGFLQYLEKKSLLGNAAKMAKIVSGSHIGWQTAGSGGGATLLLQQANTWVSINPRMLALEPRKNAFSYLSESRFWSVMRELGIKGLYVSPTGASGELWAMNKEKKSTESMGEDVVQYDFSRAAGDERSYGYLMSRIMDEQATIGSDLIPAATGLGPDFFLATRNSREYPGIYCLVEIPQDLWETLPTISSDWEGVALSQETTAMLNDKGIIPTSLLKETFIGGKKVGWAATTKITDVSGNPKRWIYRYYDTPSQPILNWEDPSRTASRILSGGVVNQVGYLGQKLIGMQFEAFRGIDTTSNISTALSASQSVQGEIKRYGAWGWLRDRDLSLEQMSLFLASGADFVTDSVMSPGAEHALMTGDSSLLRYMTDRLISSGLESKHLVHTMPRYDGVSYSLSTLKNDASSGNTKAKSLLSTVLGQLSSSVAKQGYMPVKKQIFYTTSTGIATLALMTSGATKTTGEIAKGHALLLFFKTMQPGLLMLSGQDFVGAMPLKPSAMSGSEEWDASYASRGSYSLSSTLGLFIHSGQSLPASELVYPDTETQFAKKNSFIQKVKSFLHKRTEIGIANGKITERPKTKGKGSIALITTLPSGGKVLAVCNFSRNSVTETLSLPSVYGRSTDIAGDASYSQEGNTVTITLAPWQGKAILFGGIGSPSGVIKKNKIVEEFIDPAQGLYPDEIQSTVDKKVISDKNSSKRDHGKKQN